MTFAASAFGSDRFSSAGSVSQVVSNSLGFVPPSSDVPSVRQQPIITGTSAETSHALGSNGSDLIERQSVTGREPAAGTLANAASRSATGLVLISAMLALVRPSSFTKASAAL